MTEWEVVPCEPRHLNAVLTIARQDNNLLGWAPKAVFAEAMAHGKMLVAVNGTIVGGFVEFGGTTKDKWTIYKVAVAKPLRNKGIGGKLIEALAQQAADNGAGLRLKVTEDNSVAINFYRRHQFTVASVEQSKVRRLLVLERD